MALPPCQYRKIKPEFPNRFLVQVFCLLPVLFYLLIICIVASSSVDIE